MHARRAHETQRVGRAQRLNAPQTAAACDGVLHRTRSCQTGISDAPISRKETTRRSCRSNMSPRSVSPLRLGVSNDAVNELISRVRLITMDFSETFLCEPRNQLTLS